jgi:hypothetical protein
LGNTGTGSSDRWSLFEIEIDDQTKNVSSVTDISSKLPSALTVTGNFANQHAVFRVDNLTNNGTAPIVEAMVSTAGEGNGIDLYRWQNTPNGNFVFIDGGLDAWRNTRQGTVDGSSDRVWSGSGSLNASAPSLTVDGANIQVAFKVWGAGQSGVNAQIIFDNDSDAIETVGSIAATDVGSVNGAGDTVTGLTADGTTEVTVTWEAALDGITTGDNPRVAVRVFI